MNSTKNYLRKLIENFNHLSQPLFFTVVLSLLFNFSYAYNPDATLPADGDAPTADISLTTVDDAFVRDGNYANENYGDNPEFLVKGSPNGGFTRHGFLKFNLPAGATVPTSGVATLSPIADAYVRDGNYTNNNYGADQSIIVKGSPNGGYTRYTFLKFSLSSIPNVNSAKLRIYGSAADNATVLVSAYGVDNDNWAENTITFGNAPQAGPLTGSANINGTTAYYEIDVTSYVKSQFAGDKTLTLVLKNVDNKDKMVTLNSRESSANAPQLVIDTDASSTTTQNLLPLADAYVRNGNYAGNNYGNDPYLIVKTSPNAGYSRYTYLKFSLHNVSSLNSAKLKFYANTDKTQPVTVSAFGVDNDSWTETGITFNNAPAAVITSGNTAINGTQQAYYEIDVTNYVSTQLSGDKVVSLVLRDEGNADNMVTFYSKESASNGPSLVIESGTSTVDNTPPVVNVNFTGTQSSPNVFTDQVTVNIAASDAGGSGLASTQYSLNNNPYQTYNNPFVISTAGNYTIKAKATDGNGNITITNEISFSVVPSGQSGNNIVLSPIADAFVRDGNYAGNNYGTDATILVKGSPNGGFTRKTYLKFSLPTISNIASAKLRVYGLNTDNSAVISLSAFGANTDSWTETGITFSNAPGASTASLGTVGVNNQAKYYEFDVTNFVQSQYSGDKVVTLVLTDPANGDKILTFNSRENAQNQPQLVINTQATAPPSPTTLTPVADAFVRDGNYANNNYGGENILWIKNSPAAGNNRKSFLKFQLGNYSRINTARLRVYGSNIDNATAIVVQLTGVTNDSWTENGITWNNSPTELTSAIAQAGISDLAKYYEFDVTSYVRTQFNGDKVASFLLRDITGKDKNINLNSKENASFKPELIIDTTFRPLSNALLFVENPDKFPNNDHFVFSRIQIPWSRDGVKFNSNHDSLNIKVHNKGVGTLTINDLKLSDDALFQIVKFNGVNYTPGSGLPYNVSSGNSVNITVKFIAKDLATRVKVVHETLKIYSNDDSYPEKVVYLNGLWQAKGEGSNEPYAIEILDAFGFTTQTGFKHTDPDRGDSTKLKGDEIKPSYFVRADNAQPVSVTQLAAYHGCCASGETLRWNPKGTTTLTSVVSHIGSDGQTLLPRKSSSAGATATFTPSGAFAFKIGGNDWTDATKNPGYKIGVRVWKVYDLSGNIVPNTYIISNDYLGSSATNYDYNDNAYYVSNIKPEVGSAYFSGLTATPSAVDFNQKKLQTANALSVTLKNTGMTYSSGPSDPAIHITSVEIVGDNNSEFSASMPVKTTINAQETTTIPVYFNPSTQGFKTADLLIHFDNSVSPKRVPIYGIAEANGTSTVSNIRINCGSPTPTTVGGKTWSADNQYAFDNLEPYSNPNLSQIDATDEDILFLTEQSSNGDKKPFRYEIPLANGNYTVRLHFAEIYWGTPGSGSAGGAGSRVMSVKLENQTGLLNFDVASQVGSATAIIKNIPVTVSDGKLNIDFSATVNRPMVCALEVYSFITSSTLTTANLNNDGMQTDQQAETLDRFGIQSPVAFPNPSRKMFNIKFPNSYEGKYSLQIIDIFGRIYANWEYNLLKGGSQVKIDISDKAFSPGVYYIRIQSARMKTDIIKLLIE